MVDELLPINNSFVPKLVAPVPPSVTDNVPVILVAPKSIANLSLSMTAPPFVFKSKDKVLFVFNMPTPSVIFCNPENSLQIISVEPTVIVPVVIKT